MNHVRWAGVSERTHSSRPIHDPRSSGRQSTPSSSATRSFVDTSSHPLTLDGEVVIHMPDWSSDAIKERRLAIGLSQAQVAKRLGISKSMLSHMEAGKRQPTRDQIEQLSQVLQMPSDLLALAGGRLPVDVEKVIRSSRAEAVVALREVAESQAIVFPTTPASCPRTGIKIQRQDGDVPERIDVTKTSTAYRAHSYHTKVPPEAIRPFIRAFTNEGDLVLDPFCGSGMTGVAALTEKRRGLLSDISPAAVHIARNYTSPCDPLDLKAAFERVSRAVTPTIEWLYRPVGSQHVVEYTTWSDVHRCPHCRARITYWDCVQRSAVSETLGLECGKCGKWTRKADMEWVGEEPVATHMSCGGNRIETHIPTPSERALIDLSCRTPIPYWTPHVGFGPSREMWRASHSAMGISSAADFFTRRNLHALAALRHAIVITSEGREREAMMFAFTAAVNRASKRYQWNAKRPTNVMTGTLYVSSLRYEWNVWSLFRRKVADALRYFEAFPGTEAKVEVFQRSAADLNCIPSRSVDFVFMDPPFGSNIFYADASLLWDAWLGEMTDEAAEIVINKSRRPPAGGKSLSDYADLMTASFGHVARVLRPGASAVLAFSNSDDRVWEAVRGSLEASGLDTASVHILDKGQASIKGVKGRSGKENVTTFDLMLHLRPSSGQVFKGSDLPSVASVDDILLDLLVDGGGRTDDLYSGVIRALLAESRSVAGVTMPTIVGRLERLDAVLLNGRWSLPAKTTATISAPTDFVEGYLSTASSLPESVRSAAIDTPFAGTRVEGGRGSAFYLAHSYHTKVPPEAIRPFIEHYTLPGDVVLDPFCGSGMTGVAATLAGRRSIMNDLSPAAVHLTWNHTRPCRPGDLAKAFAEVEARVSETIAALYATPLEGGGRGLVHWTMWSTRHRCPTCNKTFLLWEVMDRKTGRLGTTIECPRCLTDLRRSRLETLGSEPAWISYEDSKGRRAEKAAGPKDVESALAHSRQDIEAWYPKTAIGADREMYIRCALHLQGIANVADFYTPRNLRALALIWDAIMSVSGDRERRALAFAFTNTAWHGTRMRRFNARGGQRPLTGTLYVPQLSSEANVLEVMRNKIAQLERYYMTFDVHGAEVPAVRLGSATALDGLADASVDYIFTDPPFGSNIFYSDCNLIWEAWLGRLTDPASEAVVNRSLTAGSGGKTLDDYSKLMAGSLKEMARVLKPGGWATIVFHNTDAAVWKAIHDAASEAGFSFHEASSLDRKQQSHKGYKGRSGTEDVAHFDVVFNLRKSMATASKAPPNARRHKVADMVAEAMGDPAILRHGVQGVHAEVMRRMASYGRATFVDFAEVRSAYQRLTAQRLLDPAA